MLAFAGSAPWRWMGMRLFVDMIVPHRFSCCMGLRRPRRLVAVHGWPY